MIDDIHKSCDSRIMALESALSIVKDDATEKIRTENDRLRKDVEHHYQLWVAADQRANREEWKVERLVEAVIREHDAYADMPPDPSAEQHAAWEAAHRALHDLALDLPDPEVT